MAREDEIVLEDDWNYLAVSKVLNPEMGTVCVIEIGRAGEAPDDHQARLFMLDQEGVQNLISSLQETVT